jgi:hypothetical protein
MSPLASWGGGRSSTLGRAIGELGRVAKTLDLLNHLDEAYRCRILTQVNRGESRHGVARVILHGRWGRIATTLPRRPGGSTGSAGAGGQCGSALEQVRTSGAAVKPEDVERLSLLLVHVNVLGPYEFNLKKSIHQVKPWNYLDHDPLAGLLSAP